MKPLTARRMGRGHVLASALTAVLLLGLAACSSGGNEKRIQETNRSSPLASASPSASAGPAITAASKETYLHPDGMYFGAATFHGPARATTESVTRAAGQHPRLLEYYQSWERPFSAADAQLSYQQGALPMLTWEPRGATLASDQPQYSLDRIASGGYDTYIIRFALQVKATGRPLVLRFAHEMNGNWYPWSESNSGNSAGDYVKAYRHIHDLFQAVGATDVIWVWSPNVLRHSKNVALKPLYPGDGYVDWVGVDGYGFGERTATEVLQPTVYEIRRFSQKPILISETGSSPGPQQPGWTADLFRWLKRTPNVIGFVWFQHSQDEGGKYDYRFDVNPQTKAAFRHGLDSLHLLAWPVTTGVTPTATSSPSASGTGSPSDSPAGGTSTPTMQGKDLFTAGTLPINGQTFVRKATSDENPCWKATERGLGSVLAKNHCSQVLLATYTSGKETVTVGVMEFPIPGDAQAANAAFKGRLRPLNGQHGIPPFCDKVSSCAVTHAVQDRYVCSTVAGPNSGAAGDKDPSAVAAGHGVAGYALSRLLELH